MTEPVAYLNKYLDSSTNITRYKPENQRLLSSNPLYTAEQLHPRVKMTQAEFDEFRRLFEYVDYASIATATIQHVKDDFNKLGERVYSGTVNERIKKENEFNVLWANYNPDNPEETIEIVPDMKWFVRSKEPEDELRDFIFLSGSNLDDLDYLVFDYARAFDTKEEAEKWTNPLTESVQLPVEGE